MRYPLLVAVVLVGVCLTQDVRGDVIASSTFDTDADGWTFLSVGHTWEATGGNPGGYIRYDDNKGGNSAITAPAEYLGNWTAMGVTNLTYEAKIFYKGSVYKLGTYTIIISGPGGKARWYGPPPDPSAGWLYLDVPLVESAWVVQSGSWDALLADVTELMIPMEYYNNWGPFEITGVDNIQLCGEAAAVQVPVDIKPGSCPNPLNVTSKGVLPVAILGTEEFDVLDIVSAALGDIAPVKISYEDVGTPFEGELCDCHEAGPDGLLDLVLHFDTQEIVAALGPVSDGDELVLTLTGEDVDGTAIEGSDCIRVIKKGKD